MLRLTLISCILCLTISQKAQSQPETHSPSDKIVAGYVERIRIPSIELEDKAKLDTGAATSSMHASIVELKQRNDKTDEEGYVIFTLSTKEGESNHMKKRISRMVRIKTKDGGTQRRPVIQMTFCIAGRIVRGEVNLTQRSHFNYNILIGRNMLVEGGITVDASHTFTAPPNCPESDNEGADNAS